MLCKRNYKVLYFGVVVASMLICVDATAWPALQLQTGSWYNSTGNGAANLISNLFTGFYKVLVAFLGLASAASLVTAIIKLTEGDSAGAKKFFFWLIGTVVGFVILFVLSKSPKALSNAGRAAGGNFAEFKVAVKSLIGFLLEIVSMITLVGSVLHVINGEQDSFGKLYKWLLGSMAGIVLLSVI